MVITQLTTIFSCKQCAKFWKTKMSMVIISGIIVGAVGLNYTPKTTAAELAEITSTYNNTNNNIYIISLTRK